MTDFWKDKKIIAYIALTHHVRFISPIMDALTARGAKIKYIIGQAERSQEITAIRANLNYAHIFDYVADGDSDYIQTNYKILRDAFSKNLKSNFIFGSTPATVIDKTLYASAMEYTGFRNLIETEHPDLCLALHELHRWGKIFAFWAKKHNIPFITLQEGLYSGLDFGYTGHVQYSTLNLVWGERIKKKLVDFEAPADKIVPVGNTHLSNEIEHQKKNRIREEKRKAYKVEKFFNILMLFSLEFPPIETFIPIFDAVNNAPDKCLFIKFHPISSIRQREEWALKLPGKYKKKVRAVLKEENTYDLISMSDLCVITQPSTTGLEALAFGKPLVHLDIQTQRNLPYSFDEFNVAQKMTPTDLGTALKNIETFTNRTQKENVANYLKEEVHDLEGVTDRIIDISRQLLTANRTGTASPVKPSGNPTLDWSIIFPVSEDPKQLLTQLESISVHSEGRETFEVLLIEPPAPTGEIIRILDSLKGDVIRIPNPGTSNLPQLFNTAAHASNGRRLIFMADCLIPPQDWLSVLGAKSKKYGENKILGAKIIDGRHGIIHAGMVIDNNNRPESAYPHLSADFPAASKERPFQLLDHFICTHRKFFFNLGGFAEASGKFALMDLCLRANDYDTDKENCIYIPDICMNYAGYPENEGDIQASIYFFGKWHGVLWENREALYSQDKVTRTQLDAATMSQSMAAPHLIV